jgi:hypothetical protein
MSWSGVALFQVALGSRQVVKRGGRKGKVGDWLATTRIVSRDKLYDDTIHTHQCTAKGFNCDGELHMQFGTCLAAFPQFSQQPARSVVEHQPTLPGSYVPAAYLPCPVAALGF